MAMEKCGVNTAELEQARQKVAADREGTSGRQASSPADKIKVGEDAMSQLAGQVASQTKRANQR